MQQKHLCMKSIKGYLMAESTHKDILFLQQISLLELFPVLFITIIFYKICIYYLYACLKIQLWE